MNGWILLGWVLMISGAIIILDNLPPWILGVILGVVAVGAGSGLVWSERERIQEKRLKQKQR